MKKLLTISTCLFVLLLSGCNNDYERSSEPGQIEEVTYDEFLEMSENDETFMLLISQTYCSHCITYKEEVLDGYLADHGLTIYELNLTNEENPTEVFEALQETYDDDGFSGTPTTLIFEDGNKEVFHSGVIEEDDLDDYVVTYQLDRK